MTATDTTDVSTAATSHRAALALRYPHLTAEQLNERVGWYADAYAQALTECAHRCPHAFRCNLPDGHDGPHEHEATDGAADHVWLACECVGS
ncbi:MAG: hypothetical protein H6523_15345 [Mycolicibacterium sp.]|nr:hypothetical protein [Mycolicibacterium sp.]